MSAPDPTVVKKDTPKILLKGYIEQMFGHLGLGLIAPFVEERNIIEWIQQTKESYRLWLTYAMIAFTKDGNVKDGGIFLTEHGQTCLDEIRKADRVKLEKYIDWVIPADHKDDFEQFLKKMGKSTFHAISPTHFWFYIHVHCNPVELKRRKFPGRLEEFFCHPIYVPNFPLSGSLVVPEYHFGADASFEGLQDVRTSSCYIFPNVGYWLFDYIKKGVYPKLLFSQFFAANQRTWFAAANSEGVNRLPRRHHAVLKLNWRWIEVLEVLWREGGECIAEKGTPRGFIKTPVTDARKNEDISKYLDTLACFGKYYYDSYRRGDR